MKSTCPKNVLGTQPPPPLKERIQHEMIFLRIGNVPIVHFLVEISDRFLINEKYMPENCTRNPASPPCKERIQHEMIFLRIGNVPIVHFLVEISDQFRIN